MTEMISWIFGDQSVLVLHVAKLMEQTVVLLNLTSTWPFRGLHDIWSAIMVIFPFVLFLLKWKATNRQETDANLVVSCCIGVEMPFFFEQQVTCWPYLGHLTAFSWYVGPIIRGISWKKQLGVFVISGFVSWTWFLWTEESGFFKGINKA